MDIYFINVFYAHGIACAFARSGERDSRSKQTCVSTRCQNVQSEGHVVLCSPRSHPFAFSAQVLRALEVLEVSGGTDVHGHFRRPLAAVLDHPAHGIVAGAKRAARALHMAASPKRL